MTHKLKWIHESLLYILQKTVIIITNVTNNNLFDALSAHKLCIKTHLQSFS